MTFVTDDGKCPGHQRIIKGCAHCAIEELLIHLKALTSRDIQVADLIRARKLIEDLEGKR
jgi:hypothetical protein